MLEQNTPVIMNNIFAYAAKCLFTNDIEEKLILTRQARQLLLENELDMQSIDTVQSIGYTVFPARPPLLMPRDMPRRRLESPAGRAAFFHALAHIEFMAIYLAWDIIYRFRGLPSQFYQDWLIIAAEEAEHFELLREHLRTFAIDYGDLPAHQGLWLHAEDTADNLLARLAVVPRCMEARGLDVTPTMITKLTTLGDEPGVAILTRIYQDEIGHVERGSFWFNHFAQAQGLDAEKCFSQLLLQYYKGKPKGPFNREVRIIAGFTHNEIDWLEDNVYE